MEPYACVDWRAGRWALNAEYGLRLYHTTTTDKTGHAVLLYNVADADHPLSGSNFSHFMPLVSGRARLTYSIGRHHSLSLSNTIANRLPSNRQTVLCFVQAGDYNKLLLGNPHLKPEVKVRTALGHTLTFGSLSATTELSVERTHNQIDTYLYDCTLEGRNELAVVEKTFGTVTLYLHATCLIDPAIRLTQFMPKIQSYEVTDYRASNRMLMVGCRWSLR